MVHLCSQPLASFFVARNSLCTIPHTHDLALVHLSRSPPYPTHRVGPHNGDGKVYFLKFSLPIVKINTCV